MTPEERANLRAILEAMIEALDKQDDEGIARGSIAMMQWGLGGLARAMGGDVSASGDIFITGVERLP